MAVFLRYSDSLYLPDLLPIIPPGAALGAGCAINETDVGKVPGRREADGVWYGFPRWTRHRTTVEDLAGWAAWGASVGLQGRRYPGIDIDISDADLAESVELCGVMHLGAAPVRERSGSCRRLLVYAGANDIEPLHKRRLAFTLPGTGEERHAVELLGWGQQYLIHGPHRSGGEYVWRDGQDLLAWGAADLCPIGPQALDAFYAAVAELIAAAGGTVVGRGALTSTGHAGRRYPIGHPMLAARDLVALHEALQAIPVSDLDYDQWVTVTAAFKAGCGGAEAFYDDSYLPWALGYAGNDDDICRRKWDSITDAAVGADYIYRVARAHGWLGADEFDPIPDEVLAPPGVREVVPDVDVSTFVDRYAYLTLLDRYVDLAHPETLLKGPQLSNILAQKVGDVASSSQNAATILLKHPKGRKYASRTYRPGEERLVLEPRLGMCVNAWSPSPLPVPAHARTADVEPWLDHLTYLVPDAAERDTLLDWFAHLFQSPGRKSNWAVLLGGEPGIGKDMALLPILDLLGEGNRKRVSQAAIQGNYSSWAAETQLVVIDEVRHFTPATLNKLKAYITIPPADVEIQEKFQPTFSVPNTAAYFAFTNYRDALELESNDRRWFVLWSSVKPRDAAYYWKLSQWLADSRNVGLIGRWLLDRNLSSFAPYGHSPKTEAKTVMQRAAQQPFAAWVAEAIEDGAAPFDVDLVVLDDVLARLPLHVKAWKPNMAQLTAALREAKAVHWERGRLGRYLDTTRSDRGTLWAVRRQEMYQSIRGSTDAQRAKLVELFWRQRDEAAARGMGFPEPASAAGGEG